MIVQKYGGSSVGTPDKIKKVARRIAQARKGGENVVVVVSAMGDTTDELIKLANQVSPIDVPPGASRCHDQVSPQGAPRYHDQVSPQGAPRYHDQVSPQGAPRCHEREMDMLLTAGERVSMALLSMALRDQGLEAISFTGSQAGIITDESHTRARILEIRPGRVKEEVLKGKVVIVAGFQGVSRGKEVTTLGRGGSDTTAVALAGALGADRCEVYTDVPGVFSADPRLVDTAIRYEKLPLGLVFEMAVKGAQVMHARSIEIARSQHFPIYVGLAHNDQASPEGALRCYDQASPEGASRYYDQASHNDANKEGTMLVPDSQTGALELPKIVAVTSKEGLHAVHFASGDAARVLAELAEESYLVHGTTFDDQGGLTVFLNPSESAAFMERYPNLVGPRLSAVSVVGYQLQQNTRIPARVFELLTSEGIKVSSLTTHPQSITVWFRDSGSDTCARAVRRLHKGLIDGT